MQATNKVYTEFMGLAARAGVIGAALLAIGFSRLQNAHSKFLPGLLLAAAVYFAFSTILLFKRNRMLNERRLQILLICVDFAFITAIIWAAGIQYNLYAILYYGTAIYAGRRLGFRAFIFTALAGALMYCLLRIMAGGMDAPGHIYEAIFFVAASMIYAVVLGSLLTELAERKKLTEILGSSLQKLSATYKVAHFAGDHHSCKDILHFILAEIKNLTETDNCHIMILDKQGKHQISLGGGAYEGFSQHAAEILKVDWQAIPFLEMPAGDTKEAGVVLTLPLKNPHGILGAVQLQRNTSFLKMEKDALQALCTEAAIAIENANLHGELTQLATTDMLTGLYNRNELSKRLIEEVARAKRYDRSLSLLMVDIDGFKRINDREGHVIGDRVLCNLAELLKTGLRICDTAGRWGGDEFYVLLPETPLEGALTAAERLRNAFYAYEKRRVANSRALETSRGLTQPTTLSIGVVSNSDGSLSVEQLMTFADRALYAAKRAGKNQTKAFLVGENTAAPPPLDSGAFGTALPEAGEQMV